MEITDKLIQKAIDQNMSKHPSFPQDNHDLTYLRPGPSDEIDLGELIRNLLSEWKLVALVTLIGAAIGLAYALAQTSIYRLEAIISAPTVAQMGNTTEQNLLPLTETQAFERVLTEASKPNIQYNAYLNSDLFQEQQANTEGAEFNAIQAFNQVREKLTIKKVVYDYNELSDTEVAPLTDASIILESSTPTASADYLSTLIQLANREAVTGFTTDVKKIQEETVRELNQQLQSLTESAVESRQAEIQRLTDANALQIAQTQQQMETLLNNAREARQSQIIQYQEALKTAQSLGIEEPVTWDDLRPNQRNTQITNELSAEKPENPLYFQGTRILEAEITRLTQREDDRPFIDGYAELAQKIQNLRNDPKIAALKSRTDDTIYIESYDDLKQKIAVTQNEPTIFNNASFSQISLEPSVPVSPIAPNRKLIVVAATVLAGFAGLFLALIRIAIRREPNTSIE